MSLTWLIPGVADIQLPSEENDFVLRTIESKFQVDLTLNISTFDYVNKQNAMLAFSPPDMWYDKTSDGGQQYARDGLLADMSPLINSDTMPNYLKYWVSNDQLMAYGILEGKFVRAPIPYDRMSYRAYYIRRDWLNRLGLSIPDSYEEYLNVLRAFRNDDPDGNGKKDTYGFSLSAGGNSIGFDWPEYVKNGFPYGGHVGYGRWIESGLSLEMGHVIDDIRHVLNEDLIDPDWFLNRGTQHIEKAIQGKIGILLQSSLEAVLDSNSNGLQQRTRQLNPNAVWVPFTMFPGKPLRSEPSPGSPFLFAKTTAEQNPEKAKKSIQILDWLAGEEGFLLTHYGLEGTHYTRDGNQIMLIRNSLNDDDKLDFLRIWSFFTPNTPDLLGLTVVDPLETDRDKEIKSILRSLPLLPNIGTPLIAPPAFDLVDFRNRQQQFLIKALLEDKSSANWAQYLHDILYKYKGMELNKTYEEQIRSAGMIK
ncbi:extracellular solute-binding protein [Paenibacillus sp. GYB004]|uniref:hypothetical protein n=1 Tax=Paenibacillus sp. GYB004 TaxID=2994393 RepID=UPI002F962953